MARDLHTGVTELSKAAKHRLDDAQALFNSVRWRGSMYLAGYAVECLLKTKLMRMYSCRNLRDLEDELQQRGLIGTTTTLFTQLELLLRLVQGLDRLRQNAALWPLFTIVNRWVPAWRYTANLANRQDAEDFFGRGEPGSAMD